jgi:hypothetical protein
VLFREHGKVLHNANLSISEHTYRVRVSEQPNVRGTYKSYDDDDDDDNNNDNNNSNNNPIRSE